MKPTAEELIKRAEQFAAWSYLQGQAERSIGNIEAIGGDASDQRDAYARASEEVKAARSLLAIDLTRALEATDDE